MRSDLRLHEVQIEGLDLAALVWDAIHDRENCPLFLIQLVGLVETIRTRYQRGDLSFTQAVNEIRLSYGKLTGYTFRADINQEEQDFVNGIFETLSQATPED